MYQLQIYGSTVQRSCQDELCKISELLFGEMLYIVISAHASWHTPSIPQGHPKARPTLLSRTFSPRTRAEDPRHEIVDKVNLFGQS